MQPAHLDRLLLQPPYLTGTVTFYVAALALVFGPGALPLLRFGRETAAAERTAIACAAGLATEFAGFAADR